jgi:hypothetical protein
MACAVTVALGCSHADERLDKVGEPLIFPVQITLSSPPSVPPLSPVLEASSSLRVGSFGRIVTGTIVSMGSGGVFADADARLRDTWSRGTATLRDRAQLTGTLHAARRVLGNGTIPGTWNANPTLDPPATLSWQVSYPAGTPADVTLSSGQSRTLAPGLFGRVAVHAQATLRLAAGTYYLTSLSLESQAKLELDQSAGPVVIYTAQGTTLRGTITAANGSAPDFVLVHLATTAVFVESLFNGALIAPFSALTLRSVSGTHTGFFAAKDVALDSNARVQYRAPFAVLTTSSGASAACRDRLLAMDPAADVARYCGICPGRPDTDRDGLEDCLEECPYDALKTAAGKCGCGLSEADQDADGTPDCNDECESDPNNVSLGQCGCVGEERLATAGAPCTDSAGPQPGATCNGAGVCGNRDTARPAASCKLVTWRQNSYWLCPGPVTRTAAAQACQSKGLQLVRVDGISENRFLRKQLASRFWIGGNSLTSAGVWRWSTKDTNNGDNFWQGTSTGAQRNGLFSSWAPSAPGSNRCAGLDPKTGTWSDVDCAQALAYVCEYRVPIDAGPYEPPPAMPGQPSADVAACVTEVTALPTTPAELERQVLVDQNGGSVPITADPPTTGERCPPADEARGLGDFAAGAGCRLLDVRDESEGCSVDTDCSRFGSNFTCHRVPVDPTCEQPGTPTPEGHCKSRAVCGVLDCAEEDRDCDQIEVCNPNNEFNAEIDLPLSDLSPETFNAARLFGGQTPNTTPAVSYVDPPILGGKDHSWCKMGPQTKPPTVAAADPNKRATTNSGSRIQFAFDPDFTFDVDANPLSFGETKFEIHAAGRFASKVSVSNFLNQSFGPIPIIEAAAGIMAERCSVSTEETELKVFGLDVVDPGILQFNSETDPSTREFTAKCNRAVGDFIYAANRAKKAFRDAQTMLKQYHAAKRGNARLGEFCEATLGLVTAAGDDVFFPGGLECPANEPVEFTIQRFLDYYQAPGSGQVDQLRRAAKRLFDATAEIKSQVLPNLSKNFDGIKRQESRTVAKAQFQIGPVPMILTIEVFYKFGIEGKFELNLDVPVSLDMSAGTVLPIAKARVAVQPFAQAGVSAFVGAGRDLGPFSARVGIEGAVSLGDVKAPIFAGAGLDMVVTEDFRPIPEDLAPPISIAAKAVQFGVPKAVKFAVNYDYGASVDVDKILEGEIKGTLRIKFAFFSRTWRKRIIKFNGFSRHFDLVSGRSGGSPQNGVSDQTVETSAGSPDTLGKTARTLEGSDEMGLSEPEVPLMILQAPAPTTPDPATPVRAFETTELEGVLYDDLCCSKAQEACRKDTTPRCCPGLACITPIDGDPLTGNCTPCSKAGEVCGPFNECCDGMSCNANGRCEAACNDVGTECFDDNECCDQLICTSSQSCNFCGEERESCSDDHDCCGSLTCQDGSCFRCHNLNESCETHADCCGSSPTPGTEGSVACSPKPDGTLACQVVIN